MSFICEVCHETQGIGERPTTVVVETREKTYGSNVEGVANVGWEVVKEVKMCTPCLDLWDGQ